MANDLFCHACRRLWLAGEYILVQQADGNPVCPECGTGFVELLEHGADRPAPYTPHRLLQNTAAGTGANEPFPSLQGAANNSTTAASTQHTSSNNDTATVRNHPAVDFLTDGLIGNLLMQLTRNRPASHAAIAALPRVLVPTAAQCVALQQPLGTPMTQQHEPVPLQHLQNPNQQHESTSSAEQHSQQQGFEVLLDSHMQLLNGRPYSSRLQQQQQHDNQRQLMQEQLGQLVQSPQQQTDARSTCAVRIDSIETAVAAHVSGNSSSSVFCSAGEPCTVCHEDFMAGSEVVQLPCRHCFHEACLMPWLNEHNTCPVCRYELEASEPTAAATGAQATAGSLHGLLDVVLQQLISWTTAGHQQHDQQQQQQVLQQPVEAISSQWLPAAPAAGPDFRGSNSSSETVSSQHNSPSPLEQLTTLQAADSAIDHVMRMQGDLANTRSSLGRVGSNLTQIQDALSASMGVHNNLQQQYVQLQQERQHLQQVYNSLLQQGDDAVARLGGLLATARRHQQQQQQLHGAGQLQGPLPAAAASSGSTNANPPSAFQMAGTQARASASVAGQQDATGHSLLVSSFSSPNRVVAAPFLGHSSSRGMIPPPTGRLPAAARPPTPDRRRSCSLTGSPIAPSSILGRSPPAAASNSMRASSLPAANWMMSSNSNISNAISGTVVTHSGLSSAGLSQTQSLPPLRHISRLGSNSAAYADAAAATVGSAAGTTAGSSPRAQSNTISSLRALGSSPVPSASSIRPPGFFSPAFYSSSRRSLDRSSSSSQAGSAPVSPHQPTQPPAAFIAVFPPHGFSQFSLPPAAIPLVGTSSNTGMAGSINNSSNSSSLAVSVQGHSQQSSTAEPAAVSAPNNVTHSVDVGLSGQQHQAGALHSSPLAGLVATTISSSSALDSSHAAGHPSAEGRLPQVHRSIWPPEDSGVHDSGLHQRPPVHPASHLLTSTADQQPQLLRRSSSGSSCYSYSSSSITVSSQLAGGELHDRPTATSLQQPVSVVGPAFLLADVSLTPPAAAAAGSAPDSQASPDRPDSSATSVAAEAVAGATTDGADDMRPGSATNSSSSSSSVTHMVRLQQDLASLMQQADQLLVAPPAAAGGATGQLEIRRRHIEALTAAITATTATLRAHSAAAAANSRVLDHERRLVAAETALMSSQAALLRQREAALLLQAQALRGDMEVLHQHSLEAAAAARSRSSSPLGARDADSSGDADIGSTGVEQVQPAVTEPQQQLWQQPLLDRQQEHLQQQPPQQPHQQGSQPQQQPWQHTQQALQYQQQQRRQQDAAQYSQQQPLHQVMDSEQSVAAAHQQHLRGLDVHMPLGRCVLSSHPLQLTSSTSSTTELTHAAEAPSNA